MWESPTGFTSDATRPPDVGGEKKLQKMKKVYETINEEEKRYE